MKLTKNTNKVRVEDPGFYEPEIYEKLPNGDWLFSVGTGRGLKLDSVQFQARLRRDGKLGYRIFDISEDDPE